MSNGTWARVFHKITICRECGKQLKNGERFWYETYIESGVRFHRRMCEACREENSHKSDINTSAVG